MREVNYKQEIDRLKIENTTVSNLLSDHTKKEAEFEKLRQEFTKYKEFWEDNVENRINEAESSDEFAYKHEEDDECIGFDANGKPIYASTR